MFTYTHVRTTLAEASIACHRVDGEYRVFPMEIRGTDAEEKAAYYTDDTDDALLTGLAMRRTLSALAA